MDYIEINFALVLAVIAPWIGNISYVSGLTLAGNLDLTPFGLTITAVFTAGDFSVSVD